MKSDESPKWLSVKELALMAIMIAAIEAVKISLAFIPNVELVSLLIIMYTRKYGNRMLFVIPGFVLLECLIWGFGIWTIMYLYVWFILAIIAFIFRKQTSVLLWAVISGAFGLFFGLLCSIPYFFMGGPGAAITWWISGIPYDLLHCVSNFILVCILFKPLDRVLDRIKLQ